MGKSHMIHAAVNNCEVENQSTIFDTLGKINGINVSLLIYIGET
jgi:hypothetical protein